MDNLWFVLLIVAFIFALITVHISLKDGDMDTLGFFVAGLVFALPSGLFISWQIFKILVREALK